LQWLVYADVLYRHMRGALRVRFAARSRVRLHPYKAARPGVPHGERRKREAVSCCGSHPRGLVTPASWGHPDACEPEECWRLAVSGCGKEGRSEVVKRRP